ncbi:hypothetical protein [Flavobacterium suzhouense]|uniref:YD repeat-containing protein n=1 Tax=Flavobacterium suzhouense TaxID=1529638 RepID=A0ABW5NSJ2_9FLAO
MKTKLVCALMALFFISCSSDDSTPVDNTVPEQSPKKLDKVLYTNYENNGEVSSTTEYIFDDHDKILSNKSFSAEGIVTFQSIYTYGDTGLLSKTESEDSDFDVRSKTEFTYDNSGRLIEYLYTLDTAEMSQLQYYLYTFQYNSDGTISNNLKGYLQSNNSGQENEEIVFYTEQRTYFVDAVGNIIKRTSDSSALDMESVFDGLDLQSYSSATGSGTITLSYGIGNALKGQYHNMFVNSYGNRQNAVLTNSFSVLAFGSTKYVTQSVEPGDSGSIIFNYNYEFDVFGYPIKITKYKNGGSQPSQIVTITYK